MLLLLFSFGLTKEIEPDSRKQSWQLNDYDDIVSISTTAAAVLQAVKINM